MNTLYYLKLYTVSLLVFLGIDLVWLVNVAPNFYKANIGHLMAEQPNLIAAGAFYFLNIIGIILFAVKPALKTNSMRSSIILGAFYGFFTYATYDLTNYATLVNWPFIVVVVDMLWGTTLTAAVSLVTYYAGIRLK